MIEVFKGVVWRREPVTIDGRKLHKYAVVGVLLTERPLNSDAGEVILAGSASGLTDAIDSIAEGWSPLPALGTADDVLTSLDESVKALAQADDERRMAKHPHESWRETLRRWLSNPDLAHDDAEIDAMLAVFDEHVGRKHRTPAAIAMAIYAGYLR